MRVVVVWTHLLDFSARAKELNPREMPGWAYMWQGVPANIWATRIRKDVAHWTQTKELNTWEMPGWAYMWTGVPASIWATRIRKDVAHWTQAKELNTWQMPGWAYMWQGVPANIWATSIRKNVAHWARKLVWDQVCPGLQDTRSEHDAGAQHWRACRLSLGLYAQAAVLLFYWRWSLNLLKLIFSAATSWICPLSMKTRVLNATKRSPAWLPKKGANCHYDKAWVSCLDIHPRGVTKKTLLPEAQPDTRSGAVWSLPTTQQVNLVHHTRGESCPPHLMFYKQYKLSFPRQTPDPRPGNQKLQCSQTTAIMITYVISLPWTPLWTLFVNQKRKSCGANAITQKPIMAVAQNNRMKQKHPQKWQNEWTCIRNICVNISI